MIKATKGYHNLIVWQRARELVKVVYALTSEFPKHEIFALTGQLRRAAISVVANLVEGYSRGYKSSKEAQHFYSIASGSLTEVEALLEVALDVYPELVKDKYERIELLRGEVAYLLGRFIKGRS